MAGPGPFDSFFMAGFECSSQRRRDGRRLDLLASTGHDRLAARDYRQVAGMGLRTVRDGLRWHLIEVSPGRYDWSSFLPMLRAAREAGVQPVWDLCHYGWPDDLEIWGSAFVDRFARFAAAAAALIRDEGGGAPPLLCPVNEISFWAWAGGDQGRFGPCARRRGGELKRQLVRASIAGIDAVRAVDPGARFVQVDPVIHVVGGGYNEAQYEAWDMLCGRAEPGLGGRPEHLDIVGVNYYPDNQWVLNGSTIPLGHHLYRPFRELLADVHRRYGRPLLLAETGAEGGARAAWLHYVADEVRAALDAGVPVEGICLYPVLDYPGWENDRHCEVGLLGNPDADGRRPVHAPLAGELARQQAIFGAGAGEGRRVSGRGAAAAALLTGEAA
jgi:hypothetical protein